MHPRSRLYLAAALALLATTQALADKRFDCAVSILEAAGVAQQRISIENSASRWRQWSGRQLLWVDVQKRETVARMMDLLASGKPELVVEQLRPMVSEVDLAYHIIKQNEKVSARLAHYLETLRGLGPSKRIAPSEELLGLLREGGVDVGGREHVAAADIESAMRAIDERSAKSAETIARNIDVYTAVKSTLEDLAINEIIAGLKSGKETVNVAHLADVLKQSGVCDCGIARIIQTIEGQKVPPMDIAAVTSTQAFLAKRPPPLAEVIKDVQNPDVVVAQLEKVLAEHGSKGRAAREALFKLQPKYTLDPFFDKLKVPDAEREAPSLYDLWRDVERRPSADMTRLKMIRNQEIKAFVATVVPLPSKALFPIIDRAIEATGVDAQAVRRFFRYAQERKLRYLHFPNIETVLMASGDAKAELRLLETFAANGNDEFLVTFARRIDARDSWAEMKKLASARDNKGFAQRMAAAEAEAKKLGDIALWNETALNQWVANATDAALGYGGVKLAQWEKRKGMPSPVPDSDPAAPDAKKPAPGKADAGVSDEEPPPGTDKVIEHLKKDPEFQRLKQGS